MATTTYTIYSRYDPEKDKERLQLETGQLQDGSETNEPDTEALWREAASAHFLRAQRPPPKFVPATLSYEVGSSEPSTSTPKVTEQPDPLGHSLSSWYRSLTSTTNEPGSSHVLPPRPSSTPLPSTSHPNSLAPIKGSKANPSTRRTKDKNNWFIQKVIQSEPSSTPSTPPPPTLADILAREPPPLPSEPRYTPPVWVEIGPSNRGFVMLQKGGWNEGEALGIGAKRRPGQTPLSSTGVSGTILSSKGKQRATVLEIDNSMSQTVKQEHRGDSPDTNEVDVIDLTLSDSEEYLSSDDDGDEGAEEIKAEESFEIHQEQQETVPSEDLEIPSTHGRTALLTPIATRLKLDRLGIGLKVKTAGPYKTSVKRVTHSAAAVAAHRRAAEDARKRREKFGRGRRGYERQKRKEEDRRKDLLAYMNT